MYASQIEVLWPKGAVILANHTRDDSMPALARRILAEHHCDMLVDFGEACMLAVRRAGRT